MKLIKIIIPMTGSPMYPNATLINAMKVSLIIAIGIIAIMVL
jgi:hypothetical protein